MEMIGKNKFRIDDIVLINEYGRYFLGKISFIAFEQNRILYYVGSAGAFIEEDLALYGGK